ncbi:hypothetical protein, partial [Harryflintia acetispora]|uniref:hypothetical protein n=1 Tax=Harryflintia acetispora TaxID=1849041 RepID=UPI001050244C
MKAAQVLQKPTPLERAGFLLKAGKTSPFFRLAAAKMRDWQRRTFAQRGRDKMGKNRIMAFVLAAALALCVLPA